ncbi:MAG: sigma-70 family RNA polymerase sigma factor, partial [Candidatus Nanopelagicales bacterium]
MSTAAEFDSPAGQSRNAQELVGQLVARDPGALEQLYDSYAPRLYTYASGLLGDRQLAADVVHDTILVAYERCGQLREPAKLTAWLYAICRNECRRLQRNSRRESLIDEVPVAVEVAASATEASADFGDDIDAQEARWLVESSLPALSSGDREVLELSLRHGLDAAAVAKVLGVSVNNARARMSRARSVLEQSVGALLVLKSNEQCDDLSRDAGTLTDTGGVLTALTRKRVVRHLKACPNCAKVRSRAVKAVAVVTLPLLAAPIWLRDDTVGEELVAAKVDQNPVQFGRDGWPKPRHKSMNTTAVVAGVAGLLVVLGAGGIAAANSDLQSVSAMSSTVDTTTSAGSSAVQEQFQVRNSPMGEAAENPAPIGGDPQGTVTSVAPTEDKQAASPPPSGGQQPPAGQQSGGDPAPQAPKTTGGSSQPNIYTGPPPGWTPPAPSTTTPGGAKKPATQPSGKPA